MRRAWSHQTGYQEQQNLVQGSPQLGTTAVRIEQQHYKICVMGISIKMRWTGSSESRRVEKIVQTTPKNLPPTQFNNKESVNLGNFWKIGTLG